MLKNIVHKRYTSILEWKEMVLHLFNDNIRKWKDQREGGAVDSINQFWKKKQQQQWSKFSFEIIKSNRVFHINS